MTDREHVDLAEEAATGASEPGAPADPGDVLEAAGAPEEFSDPSEDVLPSDSPFAGLADLLSRAASSEEADAAVAAEPADEVVAGIEPPAEESVEEPVEEAVVEPAEEAVVEPVAEAVAEPVEEAVAEPVVEPVVEPTPADEAPQQEAEPGEEEAEPLGPSSPYDLPGAWFVIHSYSGYENKVRANLETRIRSMHMEDSIFDVVIPMEDVVEFKGGRKVTVPRKQFPGYLLVRMYLDDDSWSVVRNTPGVTGFVGSGNKPTPLSRREVERILGVRKDEEKKAPRFKPDWEIGETVRVVEGPFADFNGVIEDINVDQSKVRVLVDIFGRETPVELNFEQIQKF